MRMYEDLVIPVLKDRLKVYTELRGEVSRKLDPATADLYLKVDALYRAIVLIADDHDILPDGTMRQ